MDERDTALMRAITNPATLDRLASKIADALIEELGYVACQRLIGDGARE